LCGNHSKKPHESGPLALKSFLGYPYRQSMAKQKHRRHGRGKSFRTPRFSPWPTDPRVLVEESDGAVRSSIVRLLEREGFQVVGCGGPDDNAGSRCPLMKPASCPAAAEADVIFFSFPLSNPTNREILRLLKCRHSNTPIVVEVPKPQVAVHSELLAGTHVVYSPITRRSITHAVRKAWVSPLRTVDSRRSSTTTGP
jgi:hypothetical protein